MIWTLLDGTEIEVTDNSNGYNIFIAMATRNDLWSMVDNVIKVKDLTSFTLKDDLITHEYSGMVFTGVSVCDIDADENTMVLKFGADVIIANSRLERENKSLREHAEANQDKADGYDILTGGV